MTTSSDICSVSNFSKVQRQQSQILDGNCPPAVWLNGRKKLDCFHHFSRDFRQAFLDKGTKRAKEEGNKKMGAAKEFLLQHPSENRLWLHGKKYAYDRLKIA